MAGSVRKTVILTSFPNIFNPNPIKDVGPLDAPPRVLAASLIEGSALLSPLLLLVIALSRRIKNQIIAQIADIGITLSRSKTKASFKALNKEILSPDSICCINSSITIFVKQLTKVIEKINKYRYQYISTSWIEVEI